MKFVAWLVGIVALVGGLVIGFDAVRARREEGEIQSKIALLKSHGWPTCGDDMPKGPPEAENAFLVIAPHITKNKETYEPKEPIIKVIDPWPFMEPGDEQLLRQAVEVDRGVLDITAKAFRERKDFFIPHKWDMGLSMLLPEYAGLKSLQKMLLGEVALAVKTGKLDVAQERLDWIHRIEKGLAQEPVLIGRMVARSLMSQEQGTLIRLHRQGLPVLPLLKEVLTEWKTFPNDLKPVVGSEMLSGLATVRYLDNPRFWLYQSLPGSLMKGRVENIEEGCTPKSGDYVPKVGAARAKLREVLDRYINIDLDTASGVHHKHIGVAMKASEELWSTVPSFAGLVVGSTAGSEPSVGVSMELLRLQPAILDLLIRVIEFEQKGGKLSALPADIALGELARADGILFEVSTEGEKVVLTAMEGSNEVDRTTYPASLDMKYRTYATARTEAIKRLEEVSDPSKRKRGVGADPAGVPPSVGAPASP
ncbi:MAG: hypothetical protein WCK51_09450 [Armatimonadota bacterium]